ncbi:MAG TPA: glycosyltransferase family 2 protein [Phnomibacter sp.]|nr:glycosyltransferase family 2 protein [Phnomibacter sp.]
MKVVAFTIVRNAVKYGYPARESILSVLPLCHQMVVAVGNSTDGTREMVEAIADPKIIILDTIWDDKLTKGGAVLAVETNKAYQAIDADADWCIYIQADEVLHQLDYATIHHAMQQHLYDKRVEGLLFRYHHFWGSYDYVGASSKWYPFEIRIIRKRPDIFSYRDAQGFRKHPNKKLRVKKIEASVYHYGWVREPQTMHQKVQGVGQFWNGEEKADATKQYDAQNFDYNEVDSLKIFEGTHPPVMAERIARINWQFNYDLSHNKLPMKEKLKNWIEQITGKRPFDYQNYKII